MLPCFHKTIGQYFGHSLALTLPLILAGCVASGSNTSSSDTPSSSNSSSSATPTPSSTTVQSSQIAQSSVVTSESAQSTTSHSVSSQPPLPETPVIYAINSGGPAFIAADGTTYETDAYFTDGETFAVTNSPDVSLTPDDELFHTERYSNFSYALPVDNGYYRVTLHLAEMYFNSEGERVFDAEIEGFLIADDLDLYKQYNKYVAAHYSADVEVTDGMLDIQLSDVVGVAKLSALRVEALTEAHIAYPPLGDGSNIPASSAYSESSSSASPTGEQHSSSGSIVELPNASEVYTQQCLGCHGDENGVGALMPNWVINADNCKFCSSLEQLATKITDTMPQGNIELCDADCGRQLAIYIFENFTGFNGVPNTSIPPKAKTDEEIAEEYFLKCSGCHGDKDGNGSEWQPLIAAACSTCTTFEGLAHKISRDMPANGGATACQGSCATDITHYIFENFAGYNGVPNNLINPPDIAYAINAGGPSYNGKDGIFYSSHDDYPAEGGVPLDPKRLGLWEQQAQTTALDILGTEDDILFYHEVQGDMAYRLPVEPGRYQITLKFSAVHAEYTWRRFNTDIEGVRVIENLMIPGDIAPLTAHEPVFEFTVTDGTLDIEIAAIEGAVKLAALVVRRIYEANEVYAQQCQSCHGDEQGHGDSFGGALTADECSIEVCGSRENLIAKIENEMPYENHSQCNAQCAEQLAELILDNFAGFNGNPLDGNPERVPTAGDINACQQGLDADFGGLRRVTRPEYNRMVAELFNETNTYADSFGGDGRLGNFSNNSRSPASELQIEQYLEAGRKVAQTAANNMAAWAPCTSQTDRCIDTILDDTIPRAFRRPLTSEERSGLKAAYMAGKAQGFTTGLTVMLQSVLSSPNFLYHIEMGTDPSVAGQVVELSQYEVAARLSFLLWRTVPDQALMDAAASDQLQTVDQLRAQAERMLADSRAQEMIGLFHQEWLKLKTDGGDETLAVNSDSIQTVQDLVFTQNATFSDLLSVDYGFLNNTTKTLYGVTGNASATGSHGFNKYTLNDQRKGILTRAGFLRGNSPPTGRGKFIREQVLCGVIPPPPPGAAENLPEASPNVSPRDRWSVHVENPACGECHKLMDPLGFAFDHYDTLGQWRTSIGEQNWPVEAHGEVIETSDINESFNGAQELQALLASSQDTKACYTYQWMRFATGREPGFKDSCSLATANNLARTNNYTIREVILSVIATDAFRFRRTQAEGDQ